MKEIEDAQNEPDFWNDQERSQRLVRELKSARGLALRAVLVVDVLGSLPLQSWCLPASRWCKQFLVLGVICSMPLQS